MNKTKVGPCQQKFKWTKTIQSRPKKVDQKPKGKRPKTLNIRKNLNLKLNF